MIDEQRRSGKRQPGGTGGEELLTQAETYLTVPAANSTPEWARRHTIVTTGEPICAARGVRSAPFPVRNFAHARPGVAGSGTFVPGARTAFHCVLTNQSVLAELGLTKAI